MTFFVQ